MTVTPALPNPFQPPGLPQSNLPGFDLQFSHLSAGIAAHVRDGLLPVVPPALQRALDARDLLSERQLNRPPLERPEAVIRDTTNALLAGESIDDFDERVVAAATGVSNAHVLDHMLAGLIRQLDSAFPRVVRECLPEILAGLRGQLLDIVDTLRAAYPKVGGLDLDHPDTEALLAASEQTHATMRMIKEHSKRYRLLRLVQLDVLKATDITVATTFSHAETWADVRRQGILDVKGITEPGIPGADLPLCAAVKAAVCRPDVWVPDLKELEDVWHRTFGRRGFLAVGTQASPPSRVRPGSIIGVDA